MKFLIAAMALACVLNVVINARLFGQRQEEAEIDFKGEIDHEEDESLAENKELDRALQEILYQDEDQDLSARAAIANGNATMQCRTILPNAVSVIGYSNYKHPCVAFCKYRYLAVAHGRVKSLYDATYIAMNAVASCGGTNNEYVCVGSRCVLPSTNDADNTTCQALIPNPTVETRAFIVKPCQILCADIGAYDVPNKSQFQYAYQPDGTTCFYDGQQATCQKGHCSLQNTST
ncbi:uncharacterized protein LOC111273717 [Varroa jacobsoni]|uniref:uncharacterized protein LOC111273717 n=1 Tax=Varroa jacobsoni TaxID=62625 RepID=UPI000BF61391|nr:uncharacterized protein LOC111273717 [Varroa jacobsoni]